MIKSNLELYIHIPFCQRKCLYCDFLSDVHDDSTKVAYLSILRDEIAEKGRDLSQDYQVTSIFFGGGTPSCLRKDQIRGLLRSVKDNFDVSPMAEITLECNPGTVNEDKLQDFYSSGINRLSFGLQSANNKELAQLGRIHTFETFLENFDLARKAGFANINVDLMSALPGQTVKSWENTMKSVLQLRPEHISAYSLMIEPDTYFYKLYAVDDKIRSDGGVPKSLPTEEEEREMYVMTELTLQAKGYEHYEISNYARPGFACRHNIGYWERENYLGLGLGASSLLQEMRFKNTDKMDVYLRGDYFPRDLKNLTRKDQMEEFMFLGLRMMKGIMRQDFKRRFGVEIEAVYGDTLQRLQELDMLAFSQGNICLTPEGVDLSNYVFAQFLL